MANSISSLWRTESFTFDDGRLKTADYSRDSGFGLRGVSGETTGFAHANEISARAISRAGETLQLLDATKSPQAAPPERTNRHLYTDVSPLDLVPFAEKVALLEKIDAVARARDPRVAQVSASLAGSWSAIDIIRADGFTARDIRPLVRLNVSIVAETNGRRETGSFGFGGRYLYDDLLDEGRWMRAVDEAVRQAMVNLESVEAPAGERTVLLGPGLARRPVARGGRPRPRGRFQSQGHQRLFGPDRRARRRARRYRDRRWQHCRSPWFAEHRR